MTMELVVLNDAAELLERASKVLMADEAAHCLPLGLLSMVVDGEGPSDIKPLLALVEDGGEAKAVALQTPPHNVVVSRGSERESLIFLAEALHERFPDLPGAIGPEPEAGDFVAQWERLSGRPGVLNRAERIFRCDRVTPPKGVPGSARKATLEDRDFLLRGLMAFQEEAIGRAGDPSEVAEMLERRFRSKGAGFFVWVDEEPTSMAGYSGRTPNGIRISAVYTPPDLRRRGYGSAVTAAATQTLLDEGRRRCFLFTDLANPTSNHIYREIGYEPVCDAGEYSFQ
jgi:predicted GNAT family acetyltransferase